MIFPLLEYCLDLAKDVGELKVPGKAVLTYYTSEIPLFLMIPSQHKESAIWHIFNFSTTFDPAVTAG